MVIDTSAIMAILLDEPARPALARAMAADPKRLVSGATLLEATMVIESRHGDAGGRELDLLVHRSKITVVDVTTDQIEVARNAWRTFGKGRHVAWLSFGDWFSYALTVETREPLLLIGDDFSATGVTPVRAD